MMIIELDAFCDTYISFLAVRGKSLWMSRMRRGGFKKLISRLKLVLIWRMWFLNMNVILITDSDAAGFVTPA